MKQISTPELLVKHLYLETDSDERRQIGQQLTDDSEVADMFAQLSEAKQALDEDGGELPGTPMMENILRYSKNSFAATI